MKDKVKAIIIMALIIIGILGLTGCKKEVGTPEDNAVVEDKAETEESAEADNEENSAEDVLGDENPDEILSEQDGSLIGLSCIDMSNPYYITLHKSMENALKGTGYKLVVKDPESNARKQKQQIQEFIDMGIKCLFICPVDWNEIRDSIQLLKDAGIVVVNVDTQVKDQESVSAFIGSKNQAAGQLCGEDLLEKYPDGGKVVILECITMNSINERLTGFEKTISNKGFDIIARADVNGEKLLAKEAMIKILENNPRIDAIMCGNDQIALGAMEACMDAGRKEMLIYGIDGSPEIKAAIMEEDSLITASAAQSPINMGVDAVKLALHIMAGDELEDTVIYENVFLINKDNVELYGATGWQ